MRSRVFRRPGRRRHARTARCTQKSPPRRRWQAVRYHKTLHLCQAETDDQRRTFPPPRRWWQPCVTPYFADLGVGDMRGARASNIHRHPGGGGWPSAPIARPRSPHLTPYYIMCQNFSIISGVIYATTTCNPPFMFFYRKYLKKNLVVAASLSNFIP